jgi:hypothetical protein
VLALPAGRASIESRLGRALDMPSGLSLEAVLDRLGEPGSGRRRLLLIDEADVFVQQALIVEKVLEPPAGVAAPEHDPNPIAFLG